MNTKRIEGARRAWEVRKANAAAEATWFQKPCCLCGCGEPLVRHPNPERQRLFKPGDDARLKSVAARACLAEVL